MSYPFLEPHMIQPASDLLSTAVVKKLFREYLLQIGFCDREELPLFAADFNEALASRLDELRCEVRDARDSTAEPIDELRMELRTLKRDLTKATGSEKDEVQVAIDEVEQELSDLQRLIDSAERSLKAFVSDKRSFFVDQVNMRVHGTTKKP